MHKHKLDDGLGQELSSPPCGNIRNCRRKEGSLLMRLADMVEASVNKSCVQPWMIRYCTCTLRGGGKGGGGGGRGGGIE